LAFILITHLVTHSTPLHLITERFKSYYSISTP